MTDRENLLREKIATECSKKGNKWDYFIACSERYDFDKCPDDFDCLKDYMFSAICDEISNDHVCEECWKYFLEVDLDKRK